MRIRKRGNSWQLDYSLQGKRMQKSFRTKDEAEQEARILGLLGTSAALTQAERRDYTAAREQLAAAGATIRDAVDYYLEHAAKLRQPMLFREVVEQCLEAKWEEGRRSHYLSQLKCSSRSFYQHCDPEILAHQVTADMIRDWLASNAWSPKTKNVYLGDLRTIFEWAREQGAVAVNPCEQVKRSALEDTEIESLSVHRCARILIRTLHPARRGYFQDEDFRPLLPYVALGLFAGIRPEELKRLSWSEVDTEERTVVVMGRAAKTRQRRVVDLSDNLVAWLDQVPQEDQEGKIVPPNFRKRWERLRRSIGYRIKMPGEISAPERLLPWPHDVLRHTYATMHYAMHRNEMLLQTQMGHQSSAMLFQHYRALATKREAEMFWGLTPPS